MALTRRNELLVPLLKKPAKIIFRCAYEQFEHSCQENNNYHSDIHSDSSESRAIERKYRYGRCFYAWINCKSRTTSIDDLEMSKKGGSVCFGGLKKKLLRHVCASADARRAHQATRENCRRLESGLSYSH